MRTTKLQFKDLLLTLTIEQVGMSASPKLSYLKGKQAELAIAKIEDARGDYDIQHQAGVAQTVKASLLTLILFISIIALIGISGILLSSFT